MKSEVERLAALSFEAIPREFRERLPGLAIVVEDISPDGEANVLGHWVPAIGKIALYADVLVRHAQACGLPLADVVEEVVNHEVGHALGLTHAHMGGTIP